MPARVETVPTTARAFFSALSPGADGRRSRLLVVAAFEPELSPFRLKIGSDREGPLGDFDVEARACGIGLVAAAIGASLHIADVRPSAVLLIGTCGAYAGPVGTVGLRPPLVAGHVVLARRVMLVEPAVLTGEAEFPEALGAVFGTVTPEGEASAQGAPIAHMSQNESPMPCVDVATTLGVTVDDAMAGRIAAATGARVEHLEAFAVAQACSACGVPFAAVLGVANIVGSNGRKEWRAFHRAAEEATARSAIRWLEARGE